MYAVPLKDTEKKRVKAMIDIRDSTRKLIELQLNGKMNRKL